ncbi:MAG: hypothetical protein UV19_C0004G0025 [Parcubacteria group bacterium GW2011_GWA2_42_28]|nr:MAG: hypothetical protein UV19_C0004G0025 [Parcubacteria group bacterium GW2011_GWA2_42_28]KKT55460.1 MAG: hypothetical protein UW45_C0007G0025 [Parcubacteria group bacterium GW2011_GWC2_44_22]
MSVLEIGRDGRRYLLGIVTLPSMGREGVRTFLPEPLAALGYGAGPSFAIKQRVLISRILKGLALYPNIVSGARRLLGFSKHINASIK